MKEYRNAKFPSERPAATKGKATGQRKKIRNDEQQFAGQYEGATPTAEWSVSNAEGYFFSTANSSETRVTSAFTAHVRSAVFRP